MKTNILVLALIAVGFAANAFAAKPPPQPEPPQDVTVINDDTQSIPVTVQNPQTSVTVDNTTPIPVDVQGGVIVVASEPRFVGFSNDSVQGDVGLVGMHGACAATYGLTARMCLDVEVFKTPNLQPVPSVPSGWINPTMGFTGAQGLEANNCLSWSNPNLSPGYVLSGERMTIYRSEATYPGGVFTSTAVNCSQLRPVACCQ